ncbi:MAG: STAS domain-containing protein [Thermoflexales bacterium]|nr:STAS domain-containing protein [Thermoflexales bacterium]
MEASPIQKLENLLLVSVPRDLMDEEVITLRREVMRQVRQHHSRWVLLDFSQVDICDSFFGRFIQSTAEMAKLMGTEVIVSGLQDAVVETMIELGMNLPNIQAVLDLDDALALSRAYEAAQCKGQGIEDAKGELDWTESELDEWGGGAGGSARLANSPEVLNDW